jgi:uncharacterized protein (DUF2236 family)
MKQEKSNSGHQTGDRFFSPDSKIWEVDREMVLLAGGGRALLMQLAHPKVAAGVAQHSHFDEDPLGRLYRTMRAMWSIGFDEKQRAAAALERVKNVHRRVQGTIPPSEPLSAGTPYDALDLELLFWVHATLIDTAIVVYDALVMPLSPDEKSHYYNDSKKLAHLFDIPEKLVPASLEDFNKYMERMLTAGDVEVGPTARTLAEAILYPRPLMLRPAGPLFRLITAGLLPEPLRQGYGLGWNKGREKKFSLTKKGFRRLLPFVPTPLRIVPNARRAEKHARFAKL